MKIFKNLSENRFDYLSTENNQDLKLQKAITEMYVQLNFLNREMNC